MVNVQQSVAAQYPAMMQALQMQQQRLQQQLSQLQLALLLGSCRCKSS
jgi:hypothetical protein